MKCMLCGRENPDDAHYCGGCGWPQKEQKSGGGWKIAVLGCIAVLLIAAAVVIFFRPAAAPQTPQLATTEPTETEEAAAPLTPYELVAKTFVETYWNNDLPTMETLVEYHYYSYLEEELDLGRAVGCTASVRQSVPCDDEQILDIEMAISFMGGSEKVTEAYVVTVDYEAEQSGSTEVKVGRIKDDWVVVSYRPFNAE